MRTAMFFTRLATFLPLSMRSFSYFSPALSVTRLSFMASNLHMVVQMPQPTQAAWSTTVAPQPRQRSVSLRTCFSVKVPRRSRKVSFCSLAEGFLTFCLGALS